MIRRIRLEWQRFTLTLALARVEIRELEQMRIERRRIERACKLVMNA
jgi:hypothetical protein